MSLEYSIVLLIFICIYLFSIYFMYKYIKLAHYNTEGRWINLEPENMDIFVTFCPVVNTIGVIWFLLNGWKAEKFKKKSNFFKPRKK